VFSLGLCVNIALVKADTEIYSIQAIALSNSIGTKMLLFEFAFPIANKKFYYTRGLLAKRFAGICQSICVYIN